MTMKAGIQMLEEMFSDPLIFEKKMMELTMLRYRISGIPKGVNRKKNSKDAIAYKERGNRLFLQKHHTRELHEEVLMLYSQSVALAPNDSEELAYAYGNRSALLFHLKKYKDCIKDCDLALEVTKSDNLKSKLLFRKVQSLKALYDPTTTEVCNEVLRLITEMNLDLSVKGKMVANLEKLREQLLKQKSNKQKSSEPEVVYDIPAFIHQQEAPCASEAVAIEYNKQWGRHIVATRDIEPGEVLVLEKLLFGFIYPDKMFVYCQYCSKLAWSSIPCKGCIFGIYCSEDCRQKAWDVFHKFECKVFPHVWDIDEDIKCPTSTLRLLLMAVHEAGGIEQLKEDIMDIHANKDPRTKGFSQNGVFHSDKFRSFFSLNHFRDELDQETAVQLLLNAGPTLYYLATETDFFGTKLPKNPLALLASSNDTSFIAGVLARIYYLMPVNSSQLGVYYDDSCVEGLGISNAPFCSLMNHSCDANVVNIKTNNEEILVYAKYPIKKREQVFRAYRKIEFLEMEKEERQEELFDGYQFECKCLPCTENWSKICLPYARDMLQNDAVTQRKILNECSGLKLMPQDILCEYSKYSPELMAEMAKILKVHAEYLTVHCQDYDSYAEYMFRLYNRSFGSWHVIPDC